MGGAVCEGFRMKQKCADNTVGKKKAKHAGGEGGGFFLVVLVCFFFHSFALPLGTGTFFWHSSSFPFHSKLHPSCFFSRSPLLFCYVSLLHIAQAGNIIPTRNTRGGVTSRGWADGGWESGRGGLHRETRKRMGSRLFSCFLGGFFYRVEGRRVDVGGKEERGGGVGPWWWPWVVNGYRLEIFVFFWFFFCFRSSVLLWGSFCSFCFFFLFVCLFFCFLRGGEGRRFFL